MPYNGQRGKQQVRTNMPDMTSSVGYLTFYFFISESFITNFDIFLPFVTRKCLPGPVSSYYYGNKAILLHLDRNTNIFGIVQNSVFATLRNTTRSGHSKLSTYIPIVVRENFSFRCSHQCYIKKTFSLKKNQHLVFNSDLILSWRIYICSIIASPVLLISSSFEM